MIAAALERRLHGGDRRVGRDDVAPLLQLDGPLEVADLDLAADALGALAPLELDGLDAELLDHVLGHAEVGVLDVQLHDDVAVVLLPLLVELDAALHLGRALDAAVVVELRPAGRCRTRSRRPPAEMPEMAAPMAKLSQYLRAMSVEPSAPVKTGIFMRTGCMWP